MIEFDPADPFPILPPASHGYDEAQAHSAEVDRWLGLQTEEVENWLTEHGARSPQRRQELWLGLPVKTLLTPYTEIRAILERVGPRAGQTVIDLGAGYGRMGFVIARHYPGVSFIGYEFVTERVQEGRRCLASFAPPDLQASVRMEQADLSDPLFSPAPASIYFIYDYGTRAALEKTIDDLQLVAQTRAITVVGRGRSSRDTIERHHPWLSQVVPPQHSPHFSIYRSALTD